MAEVIDGFLDELRELRVFLKVLRELNVLDERRAHRTFNLLREFITIIEAFSECFHLVAIACQADDVLCAIVFEIEYELLHLLVKLHTHSLLILIDTAKISKIIENQEKTKIKFAGTGEKA
jgi:hypothetical protein